MPSQTKDLEDAIYLALADEQLSVGTLLDRFGGDDPRWVMVALARLQREHKIKGINSSFSSDCVVSLRDE